MPVRSVRNAIAAAFAFAAFACGGATKAHEPPHDNAVLPQITIPPSRAQADEPPRRNTKADPPPVAFVPVDAISVLPALVDAKNRRRPVFLQVTATWCSACKELEKNTFSDSAVRGEAQNFEAIAFDATEDSPPLASVLEGLRITAMPTILLFDRDGNELRRFEGYVDGKTLAAALHDAS